MEINNDTTPSLKAKEDHALVRRAVEEGDQRAYAILMDRYRESVFNALYKMVQNREDANDLVLEAFAKAFRRLGSFTPNHAFSTWLFRIAINNGIDFVRRRRIVCLSIDDSTDREGKQNFSASIPAVGYNPEERYIQQQRVVYLQSLMDKLAPKYRLMLEMRYFEELSYQEIADRLEIPLGTVKAQLFRAKEMFSELMRGAEGKD
jgi:RNA polymerase sigma factor (sigma-70 family)